MYWSAQLYKVCKRPSRRIFARLASAAVERSVYIEGHVADAAGLESQLFNIFCMIVGHEHFVGIYVRAKHLCPCGALLQPVVYSAVAVFCPFL